MNGMAAVFVTLGGHVWPDAAGQDFDDEPDCEDCIPGYPCLPHLEGAYGLDRSFDHDYREAS